jgi:hypothetical protein
MTMAKMDRNKLAAFAGKGKEDEQPKDPDHGGKGAKKPEQHNKGENHEDDSSGDLPDDEDSSGNLPPDEDDEDTQEGGEGKYSALLPMLEQFHEDIYALCDDLDPDVLTGEGELSEDDHDALLDAFNGLDGKVKKEMKTVLPGIEKEQAEKLAQHLADEDMVDDPDRFAALLVHLGQVLA